MAIRGTGKTYSLPLSGGIGVDSPPPILLVSGAPGSGKSTLAEAVARVLRWPLLDGDDMAWTIVAPVLEYVYGDAHDLGAPLYGEVLLPKKYKAIVAQSKRLRELGMPSVVTGVMGDLLFRRFQRMGMEDNVHRVDVLVPHNVRTERLKNRKRVLETVLLTLGDMSTYCGIAPAGAEGLDGKLPIPELVSHVIGSRGFVPRPMSGLPSLVLVPDNAERGNYAFIADLARRHGWSLLSENDLSECLASPVLGAVGEGGTDSAFYRDVLRPAITSALAAAARCASTI